MLSIITALFNKCELTQAYWESLQQFPPSEPWEIIWIDDGSTDGTREWLRSLHDPRHRVIFNETNQGFANNNNAGAHLANGSTLAFLNNDLVLTENWLPPMLEVFTQFQHAGVVGNVQRNAITHAIDHSATYISARGIPLHDRSLPPIPPRFRPVIAATAACILMTKERFLGLNGFDPLFINGYEDVDLCLRSKQAGFQNFVALESSIYHHISSSPGRSRHERQNQRLFLSRWKNQLPKFAVESWNEVALRDPWEATLRGWTAKTARWLKNRYRAAHQECPFWMKRTIPLLIEQQLKNLETE